MPLRASSYMPRYPNPRMKLARNESLFPKTANQLLTGENAWAQMKPKKFIKNAPGYNGFWGANNCVIIIKG